MLFDLKAKSIQAKENAGVSSSQKPIAKPNFTDVMFTNSNLMSPTGVVSDKRTVSSVKRPPKPPAIITSSPVKGVMHPDLCESPLL